MTDTEPAYKTASQNPAMFSQGYVVNGQSFNDSSAAIGHFKDASSPTKSSGDGTAYQEPAYKTAKQNPALFGQGYVVNGQAFPDSTAAINHFKKASSDAATPSGASLSMSQLGATQPIGGAANDPVMCGDGA